MNQGILIIGHEDSHTTSGVMVQPPPPVNEGYCRGHYSEGGLNEPRVTEKLCEGIYDNKHDYRANEVLTYIIQWHYTN